jgi:hypothetical protein
MPPHTSAYVCLRSSQSPGIYAHTPAYVCHTVAYVCLLIRQHTYASALASLQVSMLIRQHTSAYVSICHTSAYVSICHMYLFQPAGIYAWAGLGLVSATVCFSSGVLLAGYRWLPASVLQHTSAYVSIRQHISAYVSIRQHASAYVSMCLPARWAMT